MNASEDTIFVEHTLTNLLVFRFDIFSCSTSDNDTTNTPVKSSHAHHISDTMMTTKTRTHQPNVTLQIRLHFTEIAGNNNKIHLIFCRASSNEW